MIRRALRALGRFWTWSHDYPAGGMPTPMSDGPRVKCNPVGCGRPWCAVNHAALHRAPMPVDPFTVDL